MTQKQAFLSILSRPVSIRQRHHELGYSVFYCYPRELFLVGAFSFKGKIPDSYSDSPLKEKCQIIAVTFFFLQTTSLTLIGPFFRNIAETIRPNPAKANLVQRDHPTFHFLLFQGNLQKRTRLKRPPLSFFVILQQNVIRKSKTVPLLHFSALCDIFRKKKIENFNFFIKKRFALFEP